MEFSGTMRPRLPLQVASGRQLRHHRHRLVLQGVLLRLGHLHLVLVRRLSVPQVLLGLGQPLRKHPPRLSEELQLLSVGQVCYILLFLILVCSSLAVRLTVSQSQLPVSHCVS